MGRVFPINKSLWTSSYALFSAGMALLLLGACYWIVDVKASRRWTRLLVLLGSSAITVYFLSDIASHSLEMIHVNRTGSSAKGTVYELVFRPWLSPTNASLAYAIASVMFWVGVMAVFARNGITVKVSG